MDKIKINRTIAIPNYYGVDEHIYIDQLGWQEADKKEAGSLVTRDIWHYFICIVGLNISFYYPDNDTFYGLHTEEVPYTFYKLPRNREISPYIGFQCSGDTHERGESVAVFENREDVWESMSFDGKSLEYVLNHSYIIKLN